MSRLTLVIVYLYTKFDDSSFTHSKICTVSEIQQDTVRKSPILTDPTCILRLRFFWVTQWKFCQGLWQQRTWVRSLLCGFVCVILRLATLGKFRLVMDGQTDEQTHSDCIYHDSIASCDKNWHQDYKIW